MAQQVESQIQEPEQALLTPCGNAAKFTRATYVTGDACCSQFTAPNDAQYSNVSWDFDDGASSTDPTSVYHCYAQSGTYTVRHTVIRDDGSTCSYQLSVSITNCTPCPELLGISVSTTSRDPFDPLCSPTNLTGNNDGPEALSFCPFRFAPIFSGSSTGVTFDWELYSITSNPFSFSLQCTQTAPALKVTQSNQYNVYELWFAVRLIANRPGCQFIPTSTLVHITNMNLCQYSIISGDTPNSLALMKQVKPTNKFLKIYPNPVDNLLHVTNLKDSEDYTFEIHNALGQTVLTQKVSSIDAVIDVSNLMTGVYISVLKSQGKIISNNKIYKK